MLLVPRKKLFKVAAIIMEVVVASILLGCAQHIEAAPTAVFTIGDPVEQTMGDLGYYHYQPCTRDASSDQETCEYKCFENLEVTFPDSTVLPLLPASGFYEIIVSVVASDTAGACDCSEISDASASFVVQGPYAISNVRETGSVVNLSGSSYEFFGYANRTSYRDGRLLSHFERGYYVGAAFFTCQYELAQISGPDVSSYDPVKVPSSTQGMMATTTEGMMATTTEGMMVTTTEGMMVTTTTSNTTFGGSRSAAAVARCALSAMVTIVATIIFIINIAF